MTDGPLPPPTAWTPTTQPQQQQPPPLPAGGGAAEVDTGGAVAAAAPVIAYATPTPYVYQPAMNAWRDGPILIVRSLTSLPGRCVKCNADVTDQPGSKRLTQKLAWHHPALFLLILAGILIYAIVALIVQKKATVELSLCPVHNAKRTRWLAFTWAVVLIGLGMLIWGCAGGTNYARHDDMWPAWFMLGGIAVAVIGGIIGLVGARVLTPKRIDEHFAWLKGAAPEFLDNFPAVHAP